MADLNLNFNFIANAQSLTAKPNEINAIGEDFARLITQEVALAASQQSFQRARTRFVSSVRKVIQAEISRMALLIGKFLPLPDKYSGPNGQMSINQGVSATAQRFPGFQRTFDRGTANIQWQKRSKKYLLWKQEHNLPQKWWAARGDLQRDLLAKSHDFYEEAFGPIRVRLERPAAGRDALGRFTRSNSLPTAALNPSQFLSDRENATSVAGRVNVTSPSTRGKISAQITVGTLKVDLFGKITPAMLPGLASGTWNPKLSDPTPGLGLASLFPEDGAFGTKEKLLYVNRGGRNGGQGEPHHRYAIEPFVSFYLMRAIPNAVWSRTEQLIGDRGAMIA